MNLRSLDREDMATARELLAMSDLPTDDIHDPAIAFVGAFQDDQLVGVIGLQTCERAGLLRSLAVSPQHREHGIARRLCERVFEMTSEHELESLWLLTTTANLYFARLGFEEVPRDQAPSAIRATAQFASLCPASAHVMQRVRESSAD